MTFSNYTEHTDPLFSKLQILKLEDNFKLKIAQIAYRSLNSPHTNQLYHAPITTLSNVHSYNTRAQSSRNLYVPYSRTRLGQTSLQYKIPYIWNQIPEDIRNLPFANTFKFKYRQYLINQYSKNQLE